MRVGWNLKTVVFRELGVGQIATGLSQGGLVFLVPYVCNALVEQQRKDELLVVARVDQAAQQHGSTPKVAFEFLLGDALGHGLCSTHCNQPPSVMTCVRRSSASRQRASASLKAAMASGRGGMSSCSGGKT